jgi:radical SAM protein with 4Fe4S-binding SPASM domain
MEAVKEAKMPHIKKQMISFFLTTKCNLRCIYCYNSKERAKLSKKTLSLEIAKAGIDYFFKNNGSRHIRFYGPGEPTQAFPVLCQIAAYAKSKAMPTPITIEIQTNGVFGKAAREWMLENMNIIWISFDGEPDIQNSNRPLPDNKDSAPIIEDNVRWFNTNKGNQNLMVGARVTITEKNISRQKGMVDYFFSLGIRHIWTDPIFPTVDSIPVCQDKEKQVNYSFDLDKYIDNYIEAYKYACTIGVAYRSFLACNFDGSSDKHCRACTPTPHLTPDGYISACDMVTFGENAHHMDCFVYGRWEPLLKSFVFDEQKIRTLQSRCVENMPHCRDCKARYQCGGYCLGEIVNETGDMFGQKSKTCQAICRLFDALEAPVNTYDFLHP